MCSILPNYSLANDAPFGGVGAIGCKHEILQHGLSRDIYANSQTDIQRERLHSTSSHTSDAQWINLTGKTHYLHHAILRLERSRRVEYTAMSARYTPYDVRVWQPIHAFGYTHTHECSRRPSDVLPRSCTLAFRLETGNVARREHSCMLSVLPLRALHVHRLRYYSSR